MASGGPPDASHGRSSTSSIYHSAEEVSASSSSAGDACAPLSGPGKREKGLLRRPIRYTRRRGRHRSPRAAASPDATAGEPWLGRFLRLFSPRTGTGSGPPSPPPPDDADSVRCRANPLYEPVLRGPGDDSSDDAGVEPPSDSDASQSGEEAPGAGACCLPCRRKPLRARAPYRTGEPAERCKARRRCHPAAAGVDVGADLWPLVLPPPPARPPLPPPRGPELPVPVGGPLPSGPAAAAAAAGGESAAASVHSQVDYQHHFIPDLQAIYACGYYWGVMDRYEAGEVLANKPSGSFLLRDSAQSNFIFSISFRGRGRTLHARIDVFRHAFSFDCCDPQVAKSPTVMGLLAKYQRREAAALDAEQGAGPGPNADGQAGEPPPAPVSMYEPTLKQPVFRRQTFSLQDLSRAVICTNFTYDQVQQMSIPWNLKSYMNTYHYKHEVGARDVSSEG